MARSCLYQSAPRQPSLSPRVLGRSPSNCALPAGQAPRRTSPTLRLAPALRDSCLVNTSKSRYAPVGRAAHVLDGTRISGCIPRCMKTTRPGMVWTISGWTGSNPSAFTIDRRSRPRRLRVLGHLRHTAEDTTTGSLATRPGATPR